ncbi:Haloacid dehalogenase-like hydrolase (HAD) superfamily protein [Euphorbia peplus]|nr:Haloacid dehalogenase-like hydrolase (HAD) superfamily protein [Euphorbia peplus]
MNASPLTSEASLSHIAPLEAILFDVDGTLCDSDPLHYYVFREMLQEINFNDGVPITEQFFSERLSGKHNQDMALVLFPDDTQQGMKFLDAKEEMFRRLAPEKLKAVKGLYEVKKWVEDNGLKRAAVTNAPRENAELMISTLGLTDFFDILIIGNECEHPKPHPAPYLKALKELKVSKDHTFVFEDSVSGIKAGVAAGLPVVGLTTGNPQHVLGEANPVIIIKDYSDKKLWTALEDIVIKQDAAILTE